jgi:hypothetical protein
MKVWGSTGLYAINGGSSRPDPPHEHIILTLEWTPFLRQPVNP